MSSNEQHGAGRGRGSRRRGGRGPRSQYSGRPLQPLERTTIMGIWYQISPDARRELVNRLSEMLGETPAQSKAAPSNEGHPPKEGSQKAPRQRVWDRPILRDIPQVKEFGKLSSEERANHPGGNQLMSILTGVVARGRDRNLSDDQIAIAINENIDDNDALRSLFPRRSQVAPVVQRNDEETDNNQMIVDENPDTEMVGNVDESQQVQPPPAARRSSLAASGRGGRRNWGSDSSEEVPEPQDRNSSKRKRSSLSKNK